MRKYLLGIVAMIMAYSLSSFTKYDNQQTENSQSPYYWLWNEENETWVNVGEEDLEDCQGTQGNCGRVTTGINNGQPAGTVIAELFRN